MHLNSPRDLGILIRTRRAEKGWTQAELARSVGTTQRWVSEIENGKATAEIGMVLRTLAMLGVRLQAGTPDEPRRWPDGDPLQDLATGSDLDEIVDGPR